MIALAPAVLGAISLAAVVCPQISPLPWEGILSSALIQGVTLGNVFLIIVVIVTQLPDLRAVGPPGL